VSESLEERRDRFRKAVEYVADKHGPVMYWAVPVGGHPKAAAWKDCKTIKELLAEWELAMGFKS